MSPWARSIPLGCQLGIWIEEKGDDADAENQCCIPCDHLRDRGL